MTAKEMAVTYLGRIQREPLPQDRRRVAREAAVAFARLAGDPRNANQKGPLTAIGLQFAGAAMRFEPTAPGLLHDAGVDARAFDALDALYPEGIEHAIAQGEGPSISTPQRTSIQPSTFTEETTLGRIASVTFAPTPEQIAAGVKQRDTIAFWQGKKTESQAMSIDIGTVLPPTFTQFVPPVGPLPPGLITESSRPFASIQYGADGNIQNSVDIDVGLGRRITVVGNYVAVSVGMDAPSAGSISPVLTVGASIGTFAAPSQAPIVSSIYVDDATSNNFVGPFRIPARAVRMLQPTAASDTDTLTVAFYGYNGLLITTWVFVYTTGLRPPSYPIPADAYFITVVSFQGTANHGGIRIPFELSL